MQLQIPRFAVTLSTHFSFSAPMAKRVGWLAMLGLAACKPELTTQPTDSWQPPATDIAFEQLSEGLDKPVAVTHAGDGSGRLFVTEQQGLVSIIRDNRRLLEPFLDIRSRVSCCGEQGLLSIAFHPRYADNGLLYVNYTNRKGDTVVSRFKVSEDPDRADPQSEYLLLTIKQTAQIHNGGQLQFGPDGYLYVATGDGGSFGYMEDQESGGDPDNRAQNSNDLLGKLLRLDVDQGTPYGIPDDNPFKGRDDARPEVWALGLRNPWRFSFDRLTGDVFIADVGEQRREEVNFQAGDSPGGENYGWRRMEGKLCFKPAHGCDDGSLTGPVIEYDHYSGCAVIGGYRYRGSRIADLEGAYLYSDYCSRSVYAAWLTDSGVWRTSALMRPDFSISSFGEDEEGELYVTTFGDENGALYRLIPASSQR